MRTSRSNASRAHGLVSAAASCNSFSATSRCKSRSRVRCTSPQEPLPSRSRVRYRESSLAVIAMTVTDHGAELEPNGARKCRPRTRSSSPALHQGTQTPSHTLASTIRRIGSPKGVYWTPRSIDGVSLSEGQVRAARAPAPRSLGNVSKSPQDSSLTRRTSIFCQIFCDRPVQSSSISSTAPIACESFRSLTYSAAIFDTSDSISEQYVK